MKNITIQTDIVMGMGMNIVMAHARTWIAMMTEAAESMTEAVIPG
jgi:hypothetical protein